MVVVPLLSVLFKPVKRIFGLENFDVNLNGFRTFAKPEFSDMFLAARNTARNSVDEFLVFVVFRCMVLDLLCFAVKFKVSEECFFEICFLEVQKRVFVLNL